MENMSEATPEKDSQMKYRGSSVSPGEMAPEPPPRLMITKIELENFKSYAGVREIGPFHSNFSAVVGPNGSGKSNVIDAMLFVFGKRAKKLRLNKVSELIHNSDAVKDDPPTSARVSVYFQEIVDTGPEQYRVIPNTETVVTRIARKDNSSTYKIDGKNCQFKEVATYLNAKGIDLDNNRFLILQGEVEMISMMPPKGKTEHDEGLLEYLEDIIGSNKFVEETNLAAEKVEVLTGQRSEKLNRVKAAEKEKDALESAKVEAEQLLGIEREIRRQKNILIQINALQVDRETAKLNEEKENVQHQIQALGEDLKVSNDRIKEIESGLSGQRKEYEHIYDELTKTKEEFAAYERRDIKVREEIKHLKKQKKALQTKISSEAEKETSAIAKGAEAEESIPKIEHEIRELKVSKSVEDGKLEKIYEDIKGITQNLRAELDQKTQELAPLLQEKATLQASLDTAETEAKLLQDLAKRAKDRLEASEQELASLDEVQANKRREKEACEQALQDAKDRISAAEAEQATLKGQEEKLATKAKRSMARLEETKHALQSKGGNRSPVVRAILKATAKGGELEKAGILGRLGDLATIPEKYDVAVSTACGMLDHIVVHTTSGAQKCLEYLRKHNLGRANFIPLDKMKKGAHDQVVSTPENAPRLMDLIAPSNFAVTPAIYLAVGNTLVAPDLEVATRWAYDYGKRWRVVTVDGKLIDTAGTMSGGGKSVRKGGMKISNARVGLVPDETDDVDTSDIKKLEEDCEKTKLYLQECRSSMKKLVDEIRTLQKRIKELGIQIPKMSMEIESCNTTRSELTKLIPHLRQECELSAADTEKLKALLQKVELCKSDVDGCAKMASKLEKEVARLQKSILDAGGPALKSQQAICEQVLEDLETREKALKSAQVAIGASAKAAEKARKAKENAEAQMEECLKNAEEKQQEYQKLEKDAFEVMQAYEKVKVIEEEKRKKLEEASQECEELKNALSSAKCAEVDLAGQMDALKKQIRECLTKKQHWEQELTKLKKATEEDDYFLPGERDEKDDEGSTDASDEEMPDCDKNKEHDPVTSAERSLPRYEPEILDRHGKEKIKERIQILESERTDIAKNANMGAIAEYRKKEADYLSKVTELDVVTEERNEARRHHEDLRRQRMEMFMDGFGKITLKLKEMYQMITLGGDAELELVDSLDPFSEGIVFSVRPPKKSWKNISNLSGGEKTLSSLALVFALHHFKPTPLYVMDEIDAALDFKNVSIVANYVKDRTKNAQFIIISLRNNMFELADRLVGIYKTNNCTKSVTINPRSFGVQGQQNGYVPATPALKDRSNKTIMSSSAVKSVEHTETIRARLENAA